MSSQAVCPICQKDYNNDRHRRQMIICLNQHYICEDCAQRINDTENSPRCPFCKEKFNIEKIRPRRRSPLSKPKQPSLKLGLCPQKHKTGRFTFDQKACNKCGYYSYAQWLCYTCKYVLCNECITISHHQLCSGNSWIYDQSNLGCSICGDQVRSGRSCKQCSMRICYKHDQSSYSRTEMESKISKWRQMFQNTSRN